jgi:FKBP-type peptidyl-prolyl cis-trans isomerase FkpA
MPSSWIVYSLLTALMTLTLVPCAMAVEPGPVDKDAPAEFTKTPSGLKYRVRRQAKGAKPKATDTVTVHYRGWLDNGKEFDGSYKRNEPATFPLNRVIPGWTEGVQLVGKGGMIELEIPSELGYGPQGAGGGLIPPNATLHFLIELVEIK